MAKLTKHAKRRFRTRMRVRGPQVMRAIAERALEAGLEPHECTGELKDYVRRKWYGSHEYHYIKYPRLRVFHQHLFIFSGRKLITVFNLPPELVEPATDLLREYLSEGIEKRIKSNREGGK